MKAVLPGWMTAPISDLTVKAQKLDPVETGRDQIRYVDIGSLDGPTAVLSEVPEIEAAKAPSRCRQVIAAGDTLYSTVRPYLRKIGYVGNALHGEFASTGYCVLRPKDEIDSKYLFYFVQSQQFEDQILPLQKGVSYPAVLDREVRAQFIPYPALTVQRRIVEILEEHLSHLDAAADYASAALARAASLREELIRRTVTGADVTIPRSGCDLTDAGTQDGDLPSLPQGWTWRRLGDVAEVVGGVTKDSKKQSLPGMVEVPYLRVANVQRGALKLDEVSSIRVTPQKAQALELRAGDVLLNEGGDRDKLARGWVWEGEVPNCIHQNHVFRARLRIDLDPYFLSYTANTLGGRWAERNGKQSVNLASISLSMIRRMPVIVPPEGVSARVVNELRDRLEEVDRLEKAAHRSQAHSASLRRAILAAAFEGKLTGRHTDTEVIEDMVSGHGKAMR